jgi:hypothetical protein
MVAIRERTTKSAMMTRSTMQVMLELAAAVHVPAGDVADGRAAPGQVVGEAEKTAPFTPYVNILSGSNPPSNASVAVEYNHQWFWIADTDFRSKGLFGYVMRYFRFPMSE